MMKEGRCDVLSIMLMLNCLTELFHIKQGYHVSMKTLTDTEIVPNSKITKALECNWGFNI